MFPLRYIFADVFEEIPELINRLKEYPRFGSYANTMDGSKLNNRTVDDKKVTDHHALLNSFCCFENLISMSALPERYRQSLFLYLNFSL